MNKYNKFNKIASFLYKMIFYLTSAILSGLILSSLVFTVYMPLSAKERVEFSYSTWYFPILIILFILLFFKSKKLIEKISSKKLFLILSIVYFVLGLFLIIRIVGGLRADASIVFNTAVDFNNGNFSSLTKEGAYLYVYPHQLGLTTFERIYAVLFKFFKNEKFIYFFNLLFILGTNFFIYKISLKLFKNKLVTNYTIILSFLFFPHFFFQLFAYGTIPGLFFVLLGYYHLLKYNETSHYSNAMISILSFALACLIRNNYVIFVIAITLVQVFSFLENVNWRKLIVTFLIVISIPASSFLLKSYYKSVTHVPISQGLPMLAYVTMGTQDSPVAPSIGGWWDGYNTWLLKNNDFDRPKAVEQAKNDLKKKYANFL